ncbi:MAG: hypothetical protein IJ190_00925 [Prevotella sp.]|nr:hypothetical protein [Prevotella sp.]
MTKIKETIELKAPYIINGTVGEENLVSLGHECPNCKGSAFFWQQDGKEYVKEPCPVCHGKGTVTAYIHITWKGE